MTRDDAFAIVATALSEIRPYPTQAILALGRLAYDETPRAESPRVVIDMADHDLDDDAQMSTTPARRAAREVEGDLRATAGAILRELLR